MAAVDRTTTTRNDTAVAVSTTTTATTTTMELPTDASSYTFLGKIGQGAFATVWKAKTKSSMLSMSSTMSQSSQLDQSQSHIQSHADNQQQQQQNQQQIQYYVAVKVLNLDHIDSDLQEIRMEVQSMRLCLHPNILYCHTAFLEQTQLWVVTPFMNKGSSVSCLKQARRSLKRQQQQQQQQQQSSYSSRQTQEQQSPPSPFVSLEPHILYILQQTLLGLQYIHDNGQIHRDIKGGNILLNGAGEVKIADFGVSGWLIPQNEKAKTFVGTPCWMAPEVMEQIHGYDYKADLWSLGITALELAKGYAPYAKYAPMKVLILTIQEQPPSLDTYELDEEEYYDDNEDDELNNTGMSNNYDDNHDSQQSRKQQQQQQVTEEQWSPNFRQLVSWLLQKNPAQRPTCEELLQSCLLSTAVSQDVLESQICAIVPDVGDNVSVKQQQEYGQEKQQQQRKSPQDDYMLGSRRQDAVWVATNGMVGGRRHDAGAAGDDTTNEFDAIANHHQDRAPGTTWIFADGSQVLASNASLEERETDDLLSELDQFCGATGGENYRKEAAITTTTTVAVSFTDIGSAAAATAAAAASENITTAAVAYDSGTIEDLMQQFEFRTKVAKAEEVDDLDEFLDEFEKTTAGENFQRPS